MPRCARCGCRITLAEELVRCRCGGSFCSGHRPAEAHGCGHDYRAEERRRLEERLEAVVAPRVEPIR